MVRKIVHIFDKRHIWLISDRENAAGDNGESLFKYLQAKKPDTIFVHSKKSKDYDRIKAIGKVIEPNSLLHKIYLCSAEANISSHEVHMRDHEETVQVFLGHGIVLADFTNYINSILHDNVYLVSAVEREWKSYVGGNYHIDARRVFLTGLPRYDDL